MLNGLSALQWTLLVIELLLLCWFIAAFPFVNLGNIFGTAACLCLIALTLRWSGFKAFIKGLWKTPAGKSAIAAAGVILLAALVYIIIVNVMMFRAIANKPDKPNVVVVLGCQVRNGSPSRMLRRRLDAAKELLDKFPDVKCVVSGGQGSDEIITEAECMKRYLIDSGISADRIIMEDKSKTTFENLKFTLEKLDEMGLGRDITIVTDGYHQYRASLIAKMNGAGKVTSYSASTELRYILSYWVREWLGLTKLFIFSE